MNPADFGWERDENTRSMIPVTLQPHSSVAPPEVLEMIRCGCATDMRCSSAQCGYYTAHLSCTLFCECHGENNCHNEHTRRVENCDNDEDDLYD